MWQRCQLKSLGPGLPKIVTAGRQYNFVRMEGFTVDCEDHIEQLALCTEGSQALQKASAVASCREGALEGPIPVGQAARTAEERRLRDLQVDTHTYTQ